MGLLLFVALGCETDHHAAAHELAPVGPELIRVWDLAAGRPLLTTFGRDPVFDPSGRTLRCEFGRVGWSHEARERAGAQLDVR